MSNSTWDLDPLLKPKSVAIVGCSSNLSKLSGRPLKALLERDYAGKIFPVNPKYDEIAGVQCYPSVAEIPEPVDVVMVLVPAARVEAVVEECAENGVKSVIIFSSGFAELGEDGSKIQKKIGEISHRVNMPVLGPNCLGSINLVDSIPLTFAAITDEDELRPGRLALVSQSGAMASYTLGTAQEAKIGFSYWVTTGNEASLEASAVARHLLRSDDVSGVLLYLEEARDPEGLVEAGRLAGEMGKPLICLKVGRTQTGKRAAMSHTGSIAGADEEYDAAFKKAGIVRANHVEELFDLGIVLSDAWKPKGKRVATVSLSGGGGILLADRCEDLGLEVPELSAETQVKLAEVVPEFGAVGNPVDLTAELVASPGMLKTALNIIESAPEVDAVVILLGLQKKNAGSLAKDIADVVSQARKNNGKPIIVSWMAPPREAVEICRESRVPLLYDGVRAVNSLANLVDMPTATEKETALSSKEASQIQSDMQSLLSNIKGKESNENIALTEYQSKQFLARYGLSVPKGAVAQTAEAAARIAAKIGYPVVAKVSSTDILHKSDARAVRVGINSDVEMQNSFNEIMENSRQYNPDAFIDGVLVEEMVSSDTVETIVGLRWSEQFGPTIMFGMGGVFVELLKDVNLRVAPVNEEVALEMVEGLKTSKLFYGFRGSEKRDVKAAVDAIIAISRVGAALGPNLSELDINPLFILPQGQGVMAGDALMVVRNSFN